MEVARAREVVIQKSMRMKGEEEEGRPVSSDRRQAEQTSKEQKPSK